MARPAQDPEIRKKEILDAAEPLFYAQGYHETSISDIVKAMGVAQGMIYYYFRSKEDILEGLINRETSSILSVLIEICRVEEMSATVKLEMVLHRLLRSLRRPGGLLFEFLYTDQTIHLIDKISRQGRQQLAPLLLQLIEKGKEQGEFSPRNNQAAVNVILALIDLLMESLYEKWPEEMLADQTRLVEDLIRDALGGRDLIRIGMGD